MRAAWKLTPQGAPKRLICATNAFKINRETLLTTLLHCFDPGLEKLSVIQHEKISFLDRILKDIITKDIHNTHQTLHSGRICGNASISAHIKSILKEEHRRAVSHSITQLLGS